MNNEQWSSLLSKDSLSDQEWENALISASNWCSCAVGVLVLKDEVVKNPTKLTMPMLSSRNNYVLSEIYTLPHIVILGRCFYLAIRDRNLKKANEFWNRTIKPAGIKT